MVKLDTCKLLFALFLSFLTEWLNDFCVHFVTQTLSKWNRNVGVKMSDKKINGMMAVWKEKEGNKGSKYKTWNGLCRNIEMETGGEE